jgi:tRNA modification GTPase
MILDHDDQTIIAQCTPHGSGAIALLRMSGLEAISIASKISKLASQKTLLEVPSHTIHFGSVIDPHGATIDQVMFIVMHAPKTFTGHDTVEITCHNNPFLIEALIQRAVESGARLAQEGEFTKRAFMNKKIDLIQAESINELIHASTQMALKQSLAQLEGSFSHWIQTIEKELIKNTALSEASFEFIDEEMEFGKQIHESVTKLIDTIALIKKTFNQQQHIRQGVRIALIGSVNAGKSSLFNALLNKNRSIVTSIAGTTRDVVEAGVYKNSSYWTLIDTAGLRQTHDIIEQEGIQRSYQEAQQADCIVLIYDGSRLMTEQELSIYHDLLAKYSHKTIVVKTKSDLAQSSQRELSSSYFPVSVHDKISVYTLEKTIEQKIEDDVFKNIESPFLLNKRQYNLLLSLESNLVTVKELLQGSIAYELVSHHLHDALEKLTELSGKTISEQSMDAIFREFCVGK